MNRAEARAAEIRWRCERLAQLLETQGRHEALANAEIEARQQPWIADPRPALSLGPGGYVGED